MAEFTAANMTVVTLIIYTGMFLFFGATVFDETLDRIDAFSDNGGFEDIIAWGSDSVQLLFQIIVDSFELIAFIFTIDMWPIVKLGFGLILALGWAVVGLNSILPG